MIDERTTPRAVSRGAAADAPREVTNVSRVKHSVNICLRERDTYTSLVWYTVSQLRWRLLGIIRALGVVMNLSAGWSGDAGE